MYLDLLLPLMLLLVFGIVDFGRAINAQITLTQAARARGRAEAQSLDGARLKIGYPFGRGGRRDGHTGPPRPAKYSEPAKGCSEQAEHHLAEREDRTEDHRRDEANDERVLNRGGTVIA